MDQHKEPWIETDVLEQLELLISSRGASYPDSKKKKKRQRSPKTPRLFSSQNSVDGSGELRLSQNRPRVLQIEKVNDTPNLKTDFSSRALLTGTLYTD